MPAPVQEIPLSLAQIECVERIPDPCGIVIFGASGDLTFRKLIPSIYHLHQKNLLSKNFYVVGFARSPMHDEAFRKKIREALHRHSRFGPVRQEVETEFLKRFHYCSGDYQDPAAYQKLSQLLEELDRKFQIHRRYLFHLAIPPNLHESVVVQLKCCKLTQEPKEGGFSRIILEKPFGESLKTAQALNRRLSSNFKESQIYRIDHYLGKETVQNVMVLRFANAIFEPVWNRRYVDHVQITVAEELGIERRGEFYERTGALRDMFQNHVFQLLSLVTLEPPTNFEGDSVRDETVKVLNSIRPLAEKEVGASCVRGQYGPGQIHGAHVKGYREEEEVNPGSHTETYAALKLQIDNWRWQGVPFYLRTGKRLAKRITEIAIEFKRVPHLLFKPLQPEDLEPNLLVMRLQPDEGISLSFEIKLPGHRLALRPVSMDFKYASAIRGILPDAYERLLLDAMLGDQTLFARADWIEQSWELLGPVLEHWEKPPKTTFPNYLAGSWGPQEADELLARDGHCWRKP